jgi:hypothetical protein
MLTRRHGGFAIKHFQNQSGDRHKGTGGSIKKLASSNAEFGLRSIEYHPRKVNQSIAPNSFNSFHYDLTSFLIIKEKSSIILPVRKEVFYANTHDDSNVFEGASCNPGRNP